MVDCFWQVTCSSFMYDMKATFNHWYTTLLKAPTGPGLEGIPIFPSKTIRDTVFWLMFVPRFSLTSLTICFCDFLLGFDGEICAMAAI